MVRTLSVLAAAGLAAMVTAAPAAPVAIRQQTCYSGFYMIVGRGSNEMVGEGKPAQVADLIAAAVPDSGSVAVNYPAEILSFGETYVGSVIDGINDTKQKIQDYVSACGESSRIVLLGFSQGGNVMTDVLAGGVDKPDPIGDDLRPYIAGVAVFGDPTHTAGQSFDQGTATGSGIFSREAGGDSLALLSTYSDILRMYCDDNDIVCDSGDSVAVHSAEVPTNAQAAADFIASLA